jgi:cytochrome c-type biogenesis protein CcmH
MRWLPLFLMLLSAPANAVQPDEVLSDPVLEGRARALSQGLRCLVCRNENIDESNADLARDLRILLRERLVAGDSDEQVIAYLVGRYGEYVLLQPTTKGANLILWIAGPAMLVMGLGGAAMYLRRRRSLPDAMPEPLSEAERARLSELIEK